MKVTSKDIAKIAGVSQCTVSKVLNDAPIRVSKATRKKVLAIAKKLNYLPNRSAKALKSGKHNAISVIAYNITDAFAVECMAAMEAEAATTPYSVMWTSCAYAERDKRNAEQILYEIAQSTDGIIIISATRYLKDADIINFWANTHIPIVTVIRTVPGDFASSVTIDEEAGAAKLINHLIKLGHRKIAFCRPPDENISGQRRYNIYKQILSKRNLHCDSRFQIKVDGTAQEGYKTGLRLIVESNRPTVVVGFNDLTAIGLIKACYEKGLDVPRDISIASFDNIHMSALTTPALTTVATDFKQLAKLSLNELFRKIDTHSTQRDKARHFITKPKLLIRQSTAPPPAATGNMGEK